MTPEEPLRHLAFRFVDVIMSWELEFGLGGRGLVLVADANL